MPEDTETVAPAIPVSSKIPARIPFRERMDDPADYKSTIGRWCARGEPLEDHHGAPVAVWQFGSDLTLVALSGEVVGEYVPLIDRALGPLKLWTAAYCNAVSGYIPTRATLERGGYECRGLYEGTGFYAPETENVLVRTAADLAKRAGREQ